MQPKGYARLLSILVSGAIAPVVAAACGGSTSTSSGGASSGTSGGSSGASGSGSSGASSGGSSGSSGSSGASGSSGIIGGGCTNGASQSFTVDPNLCAPQLSGTYTCGGAVCSWTVVEPCAPDGGAADAGADAGAQPCLALCNAVAPAGHAPVGFCIALSVDGGPKITANCGGCGTGRPPRGFSIRRAPAASLAGSRLGEMAQLEAASVAAFRALYIDLARLGAPRSLLLSVRAAGEDEVRHARATRRAAVRYGAKVPRTRVHRVPQRSARELAIENAEEGCVKETFGAALAAVQAETAADARVRRTMRRIAADELRHAALSWRVAEWLARTLDDAGRAAVAEARRATVAALRAELAGTSEGVPELGLPDAPRTRALLEAMQGALVRGDLAA